MATWVVERGLLSNEDSLEEQARFLTPHEVLTKCKKK